MSHIGETIRTLRRKNAMTQENLADRMNVSVNAVSKWERGECMPDISLLIPLAKCFGITTDELLGYDRKAQEEIVDRWIAQSGERFDSSADPEALREYYKWERSSLETLIAEYPDDCRLLNLYLNCLSPQTDGDEFERICILLLDRSDKAYIVQRAVKGLAELHRSRGDTDAAEKLIREKFTGLELVKQLYDLTKNPDTHREYVYLLTCELTVALTTLAYEADTYEESARLFDKTLAVLDGLTAQGDEGYLRRAWYEQVYYAMFRTFSEKYGRTAEAAEALKKCFDCYEACAVLPTPYTHSAGFFAGWRIPEAYGFEAQEQLKDLKWLKELLRTTPAYYEPMKDSEEFRRLVSE